MGRSACRMNSWCCWTSECMCLHICFGVGGVSGWSRVTSADLITARSRSASQYRGYVLEEGRPEAVTVVEPTLVATFAHGSHASWSIGDMKIVSICHKSQRVACRCTRRWERGTTLCVQIFVNDEVGDRPREARAVVVRKRPALDIIILQVILTLCFTCP